MKRVERRVFKAFKTADEAIQFSFAPFGGSDLEQGKEHVSLDPEDLERGLEPVFEIKVNGEALQRKSGLEPDDLMLSITSRDYEAKIYEVLHSKPLPDEAVRIEPCKEPIRPASGVDFDLIVHLKRQLDPAPNRPYRLGSVIARKTISVGLVRDARSFPIVPKTPEDFVKIHMPPSTLWYVNFLQDNVDAPIASVVEIWINASMRNKLNRAIGSAKAGRLLAADLASEMFATIALETIIRSSGEPAVQSDDEDDTNLLNAVVEKLGAEQDLDYSMLRDIAKESDAHQRFRALAQSASGVTGEIGGW